VTRPPRDASGRPLHVMFVHAHPDDETTTTGATIASYAAAGARVTLVTCTRGEQGELVDPDADPATVTRYGGRTGPRTGATAEQFGRLRSRELTRACRSLGIGPAEFLGGPGRWHDSGMAGTPTRHETFAAADPDDCTRALVALIRTRQPQVMVTYDKDGGYGHPDHIRAHQITMAAADAAADPRAHPDRGTLWTMQRVLAAVVPHSALRAAARQLSTTPTTRGQPVQRRRARGAAALRGARRPGRHPHRRHRAPARKDRRHAGPPHPDASSGLVLRPRHPAAFHHGPRALPLPASRQPARTWRHRRPVRRPALTRDSAAAPVGRR